MVAVPIDVAIAVLAVARTVAAMTAVSGLMDRGAPDGTAMGFGGGLLVQRWGVTGAVRRAGVLISLASGTPRNL